MSVATTTAIGIAAGVGAAGSIGSSMIGASAAGHAADAQAAALQHGYDLQHQDNQNALAFQKQEYNTQQQNIAPWLRAGQGAVNELSYQLAHNGFPDWQGQFQAPTGANEQNDPGYKFRFNEGERGIEASAAARGGLLSGGTGKALTQYGQDYASNEYSKVYDRALGQYQMGYNQFQQNQANRWNRYASLSGTGQVAAGQLGQFGQAAAGNVANIYANDGSNALNAYGNIGAARASGYIGQANAYASGLGGLTNAAQSYSLMNLLNQGQGGGMSG